MITSRLERAHMVNDVGEVECVVDESRFCAVGRDCFVCGEPLSDPAVMWMGSGAEIYMHSVCVVHIVQRLLRDVEEIERAKGAVSVE